MVDHVSAKAKAAAWVFVALVYSFLWVALGFAALVVAYNSEFEIVTCVSLGFLMLLTGAVLNALVRKARRERSAVTKDHSN
jgi:uncharacterized membrane protein